MLPRDRGRTCPYANGDPDHWPTRVGALELGPDGTPPHKHTICAECYQEQFARKYPGEPVPDVSRVKARGGPEFSEDDLAARATLTAAAAPDDTQDADAEE